MSATIFGSRPCFLATASACPLRAPRIDVDHVQNFSIRTVGERSQVILAAPAGAHNRHANAFVGTLAGRFLVCRQ